MTKLLLAGVGAAVLAVAPARAADLPAAPVVAPVVAPAPWSWTGFYVGGNAGYSWGNSDATGNVALALFVNGVPFNGLALNTPQSGGGTNSVNGWLGGGQAGFNWQTGPLVLGVEADFQSADQLGSNAFCTNGATACPAGPFAPGTAPFMLNVAEKLVWFGTARARAGFGGDRFLFYVTGGAAAGKINADHMSSGTLFFAPPIVADSASFTKRGWVVGGGVEARLIDNWTAKVEYLYMDLGTFSDTLVATGTQAGATSTVTTSFTSRLTDSIVRVGVNYKFWWADPVVARY
jgi:outer membrane immunogenic protein